MAIRHCLRATSYAVREDNVVLWQAGEAVKGRISEAFTHRFINIQIWYIKFHKDSNFFTLFWPSGAYILSKTLTARLKELLKFRQHAEYSTGRLQSRK
ncbi:hypothetical protein Z042_22740 [Chania multitudinisentens RB-25]|uniref:Uncharacterized protein n=1 Tax=Chania multitudinisentens RB-25 TaxID=1441930 RepID=W0LGW6_9GAMM|nr:hypothetical protein Z042_22740 [Chania multitudinisentens RB-25]